VEKRGAISEEKEDQKQGGEKCNHQTPPVKGKERPSPQWQEGKA